MKRLGDGTASPQDKLYAGQILLEQQQKKISEAGAAYTLALLESSITGAHFYGRHGAQTTLQEQYIRSMTGLTPDGFQGNPVTSTRFLSNVDQLEAVNIATQEFQQSGKTSFSFDMGRDIGEGYLKGGTNYIKTTQVHAVFKNGQLYTMYPKP